MKINWLTINGQPVPTTFRQKIAIVLIGLFGIFGAILALIIVLLIFVGFLLLLASPFIIAGVIGAYLAGV